MSETPSSRQDHARPQGEQGMGAYGTKCNYCHIMREAARRYLAAGLSVIPIRPDGTKAPALPEWKTYQQRRPTPDECTDWWDNGEGIAVVGGKVSGNLEILDLDRPGLDAEFLELAD